MCDLYFVLAIKSKANELEMQRKYFYLYSTLIKIVHFWGSRLKSMKHLGRAQLLSTSEPNPKSVLFAVINMS